MRKSLFFAVFTIILSMAGLAQNGKISYQAVVRNSANQLVHDQDLDVTVGIANSETGTAVYTETHAVHSNANGLISLLIGNGTPVAGSNWDAIQWNHAWVTAVVSQGGTELVTHHLPLSAVPYALYADQVDPAALANYLTANHYLTEEVQVLSISHDTVFLTGGSFVKLPVGFSGNYNDLTNKPTNVSTFNNDAGYLTKDSAVITNLQGDVTNLQGDVTTLNTNVTQLQEATRKDALCDSVEACVKGWISDSTRMVYDSLHTYYATTDALKDSLTRYVSKEKLNDTLGHYLQADDLCDSIVKCDVIRNLRDSVQNNTENITNNTTNITNITNNITNYVTNLQGADSVLAERLAADSTNLADNYYNKTDIDDTLSRYLQAGDLCDSIVKCDVIQNMRDSIRTNASDIKSLQNADAALSARITADSTNLAGNYCNKTSIKDTLSHYLMHEEQMLSIGHDTIYLSGGSFVKLPAGFGGSYHDLVDTPTNVSAFTNDAGYLTSFTEQQMLSISNDTIYLTGGSFVKLPAGFSGNYNDLTNKPDLGQYATNEHLNDTLNNYYTQTQIKDTLSHYLQAGDLCDSIVKCDIVRTLRDSIQIMFDSIGSMHDSIFVNTTNITNNTENITTITNNVNNITTDIHALDSVISARIIRDSTELSNRMDTLLTHVCDSVETCVKGWISDSTRMIVDSLGAYYDTTLMKKAIHDTADVLRSMMTDAANDAKITIQKNGGDVGHFTLNQATDQAINILVPTTVAEMTDASNYVTHTQLNDTLGAYYDTTAVRTVIHDSLGNYQIKDCADVTNCVNTALADGTSATNRAIDSIAENIAGYAIHDTLVHNVQFTNKGDSLFLRRGGIVDTVKFPAAKMIQDSLEKYVLKTAVRDSITNNVNLTVKNDSLFLTHGNDIDTVPAGKMIKDSIENRVHDGKLAVITHGATKLDTIQKFTANQAGNDTLDLSRYVIMDTLHDFYATKASLADSMKKVDTRIKKDSLEVRGLYIEAAKTLDSLAHVTYRDSINLKDNYYTRNQVDSTADAVRSEIGNGKLTIQYGTNDPVTFNANQKTDTSIVIPVPTAPNDNLITIQMNGQKVDDFTLNQSTDKTINLQNVAIDTAANTFSGKNTFTDTNYVEKNGFSFNEPNKTTGDNCQVMVNACDLLAIFDSLSTRIDNVLKTIDTLKKQNDSLACELDSLKKSTMPSLALNSDKPSDTCVVGGSVVEITYKAALLRTNGTFNYKWYVNGAFLREGTTKDTIHLTTDTAGVIKVLCVATATSDPTVLKDSLTTSIGIRPDFDFTILGGNSADFGKIRINSSTASSAVWKDEDGNVVGNWNSGLTDILPVGKYTVELTGSACDSIDTIDVVASPLCPVDSWNANEENGAVTVNGKNYIAKVKDIQENEYNVVNIDGICWTRENMRATKYYKDGNSIDIEYNPLGYRGIDKAYYTDPNPVVTNSGYLYNWTAATGDADTIPQKNQSAYTRGICPEGWHVPSLSDANLLLSFEDAAQNTGKLAGSLPEETWGPNCSSGSAPCNLDYMYRNSSGFSAINTGIFDLDASDFLSGKAYFWMSYNHNSYYSAAFGIDNTRYDIDCFGTKTKWNEYSVRCVRGPALSLSSNPESDTVLICDGPATVNYTASILNGNADDYSYSWSVSSNYSPMPTSTTNKTFVVTFSDENTASYTVKCTATKGDTTLVMSIKKVVGCAPDLGLCIHNLTVTVHDTIANPTSIDWGDGSSTSDISIYTTSHTYSTAGEKTITVSNDKGSKTIQIEVTEPEHTTCKLSEMVVNTKFSSENVDGNNLIDSVQDHQGNWYEVVQIGSQCWLKENMRCTTTPKGASIVYEPTSANDHTVLISYTTPRAHWYNNDRSTYEPMGYGLLYNWCAAMDTAKIGDDAEWSCTFTGHRRGICPKGWHVPTSQDWSEMETVVNDNNTIPTDYDWQYFTNSGDLTTSCNWTDINRCPFNITLPHEGAPGDYSYIHNSSGFSILPAGCFRDAPIGFFYAGPVGPEVNESNYPATTEGGQQFRDDLSTSTAFWSSDESTGSSAWIRYMVYTVAGVFHHNDGKQCGYSVRCVRDTVASLADACPTLTKPTSSGNTFASTLGDFTGTINDLGFLITTDDSWATADTVRANNVTLPYEVDGSDLSFSKDTALTTTNLLYYIRPFAKVDPAKCQQELVVGDTMQVIGYTSTPITVSGDEDCVYEGKTVTLTAPAGYSSYSWSIGQSGQSITVTPSGTTVYTVTASNSPTNQIVVSRAVTALSPVTIYSAPGSSNNELVFDVREVQGAHYVWRKGADTVGGNTNVVTMTFNQQDTANAVKCYVEVSRGNCSVKDSARLTTVVKARDLCGVTTVTDHEGNRYNVVAFANTPDFRTNAPDNNKTLTQCWTKENMRAVTSPSTGTYLITSKSPIPASYTGKIACWTAKDSMRYAPLNYGVQYNWCAAFDLYRKEYSETEENTNSVRRYNSLQDYTKGICPVGWHISNHKEWTSVEASIINRTYQSLEQWDAGHSGGARNINNLGSKMVTGVWSNNASGCRTGDNACSDRNLSDLSIVPAGTNMDGIMDGLWTHYWTAEYWNYQNYSACGSQIQMYGHDSGPIHGNGTTANYQTKDLVSSVRCVKDYDDSYSSAGWALYYYGYNGSSLTVGFQTNPSAHVVRRGVIYSTNASSVLEIVNPSATTLQSTDGTVSPDTSNPDANKIFEELINYSGTTYLRVYLIYEDGSVAYGQRFKL